MFAKALSRLSVTAYRPAGYIYHLFRVYKAIARGPALFAPVLVAEEARHVRYV